MPVATPKQYAAMLDAAQKGGYAYPAINVTSIAGSKVHPFAGVAYACSKAALSALTREMAHDFGEHGHRLNNSAYAG